MKRITTTLLGVGLLGVWPCAAGAGLTEDDFYIKNAQDLVDLCAVSEGDPLANQAIHFCEGFASGAWQYYELTTARTKPFVCLPEPRPSRDQAVAAFVAWARDPARAGRMAEPAVETLFRFLHETWPCAGQAAGGPEGRTQ